MVLRRFIILGMLSLAVGLLSSFVHDFRNNTRIELAYWFEIALYQTVAFTNAFLFGTEGTTQVIRTFPIGKGWRSPKSFFC